MSSSYKPKLLEIFLSQKQDDLPDLVEIKNIPQRDIQIYQETPSRSSIRQSKISDDSRLDLSIYRQDGGRHKQKQTIYHTNIQQQSNTLKYTNHISRLQEQLSDQRRKCLIYEQKTLELETLLNRNNVKLQNCNTRIQELEEENYHLRTCQNQLQKQIKQLRLIESSQFNSYSKKQPVQQKKEIFQKLKTYMNVLVEDFIGQLKSQKMSKNVESIIEEFLNQLLQINSQSIQTGIKNRPKPQVLYKESPKETERSNYQEKESSRIESKHKFQYSPFKAQSFEKQPKTPFNYSRFQKMSQEEPIEKSKTEYKNSSKYPVEQRFNFIKESVHPTINDDSAFVSISYGLKSSLERSNQKSQAREGRSRSQRRYKIFDK